MYIIVDSYNSTVHKATHDAIEITDKYLVVDKNNFFIKEGFGIFETTYLPEDFAADKYCYTHEDGFYENPNYVEPNLYGIPDELLQQIKNDTVSEIQQEVINNAD